jgi:integrase
VYWVSRQLGHSDTRETVRTYGRWLPTRRSEATAKFDRVLSRRGNASAMQVVDEKAA